MTERIEYHDNGGETFDRYTVVFLDRPYTCDPDNPLREALGMSERPFHPQGFGQHVSAMPGDHIGKRITFEELPPECQKMVRREIEGGDS